MPVPLGALGTREEFISVNPLEGIAWVELSELAALFSTLYFVKMIP